jgi:hypothetical protein
MLRRIAAVVAGLLVLAVVVLAVQQLVGVIHPLPAAVDPRDQSAQEAFQARVAELPPIAWLLGFVSEIAGAFLGALTAGFIARDRPRTVAAVVVGLSLLGSVLNWNTFAHPAWFIVGELLAYPLVLWAASVIVVRKRKRQRIPAPTV